jgi:hypothetical protein
MMQNLLTVQTPNVATLEDFDRPSPFDSQLYLFEAVGYMISVDSLPEQRQKEILTVFGF